MESLDMRGCRRPTPHTTLDHRILFACQPPLAAAAVIASYRRVSARDGKGPQT